MRTGFHSPAGSPSVLHIRCSQAVPANPPVSEKAHNITLPTQSRCDIDIIIHLIFTFVKGKSTFISINGINDLAPVKISSFKRMDKSLGSSDIGRNGNVMNIAESQQVHFIRLVGLGRKRISEKQEQVDLVARNTCAYLLISSLCTAQIPLNIKPVA